MATVIDYITGKELRLTPEEKVRQELEHILVDALGYPKEHMDIEFKIQRGSNRNAESADIAIFRDAKHEQTNLLAIVETKAPGHKLDNQAFSYVTATTAELVMWFDGLERGKSRGGVYFYRDMVHAPTDFVEIPNFPGFGESLDSVGKYLKSELRPVTNLKGIFRQLHNRLYAEGPLKREDAIAQEVIKLLFCKLYDELYTTSSTCEFSATVKELQTKGGRTAVAKRIRGLFKQLQNDPAYGRLFVGERLLYPDDWIAYIVGEIQPFGLTHEESSTDAIGDAYEVFVGPQLKGESGQFFTPRSVVSLAVNMMSPSLADRESIIDPACGSGGFLSFALRHVRDEADTVFASQPASWRRNRVSEFASSFIHGMDADPLLYKVAKSYMAVVGNGRSGIFHADSLGSLDEIGEERIQADSFDVVLTNPPFGTKIKIEAEETLTQFELAHALKDGKEFGGIVKGGQDPAILFIERCHQLLRSAGKERKGGRMAIVLPRQILSGQDRAVREIRHWILRHFRLLAVVDLPAEAFQPYTGTITSILFAEKDDNPPDDYDVFMGVAEHVGHDRRGAPLMSRDERGMPIKDADGVALVLDDTPEITDSYKQFKSTGSVSDTAPGTFTVPVSDIFAQEGKRLDAWFYDPGKNDVVKRIWDVAASGDGYDEVLPLSDLVKERSDVFYPGRHKRNYCEPSPESIPFLSGTNILQGRAFGVKWQPREYKPVQAAIVKEGTILITRSGSVGRVVFVGPNLAGFDVGDGLAVSEHVIRVIADPEAVDPGYLYAFLASEIGGTLLDQGTYASVVQHITPQHVLSLPIPLPDAATQKKIGDRVRRQAMMASEASSRFSAILGDIESSLS